MRQRDRPPHQRLGPHVGGCWLALQLCQPGPLGLLAGVGGGCRRCAPPQLPQQAGSGAGQARLAAAALAGTGPGPHDGVAWLDRPMPNSEGAPIRSALHGKKHCRPSGGVVVSKTVPGVAGNALRRRRNLRGFDPEADSQRCVRIGDLACPRCQLSAGAPHIVQGQRCRALTLPSLSIERVVYGRVSE